MALLTNTGKLVLAEVFKNKQYWCAWGTGDPSWDGSGVSGAAHAPTVNDTALVNEIGRRIISNAEYCTPDANGDIVVPSGTYSASQSRTRYVHLRFNFSLLDSPEATIREVGVFANAVIANGAPSYITPSYVTSPGDLVAVERFDAVVLQDTPRRVFDFVITI